MKEKLVSLIELEHKDEAILLVFDALENKEIGIKELVVDILFPLYKKYDCNNSSTCIWKKKIRFKTIEAILQAIYPFVLKSREKNNVKMLIASPSNEYSELGLYFVYIYATILGYDCIYFGENTNNSILEIAVKDKLPDYLILYAEKHFSTMNSNNIIKTIKDRYPSLKIILSGHAFSEKSILEQMTYDSYISSFTDLEKLEM